MEHVPSWLQAALLPEVWEVAGVRCRALSVWHAFVLKQLGNPYLHGETCDREAAASLLALCSLDYAGGRRFFSGPFFRRRSLARVNRRLRAARFTDIHAAITDYLSACLRAPGHKRRDPAPGQKFRPAAAPVEWLLVEFLARGNPARLAAAWDTPYLVARCLFDASRDLSGDDDSLESPEEERRFDAYQRREREQEART